MALVALHQCGKLKYIISQNVDSLHLRSGIPRDMLAELHGNVFKESCHDCKTEYYRPYDIKGIGFKKTGRKCSIQNDCGGELYDDLLDWDDALPESELEIATLHCERADLSLCLGTSLRVQPASELPILTKQNGGDLAIVNLQTTKKDGDATIRIFGYCDDILDQVMKKLSIEIPSPSILHDFIINKKTFVFIKTAQIIQEKKTKKRNRKWK